MRWLLLALAACRAHPRATVSQVVDKPVGVQLVVADADGVQLVDLAGRPRETWSRKPATVLLGALPNHRGVVAMAPDGNVRIVRPGDDHAVAQVIVRMACGAEGVAGLEAKTGRLSPDGRAACIGLAMSPSETIVVETTVELLSGKVYQRWADEPVEDCRIMIQEPPATLACPPPARPLVKTIAIEGDAFTLVSVSPTKRWEVYAGPIAAGDKAPLLFVDTVVRQRYAPGEGDWPPALQPGHPVTNAWPVHPQIEWLADDLARIDPHALVELGKRVSFPGAFVRW